MRKQIYSVFAVSGVLLFMSSIFNSCIQEDPFSKATVETSQVSSITEATATCIGIITADGGSEVTKRGFCWSTSPIPTIENDTTIAANGTPDFSSSIKGLSPGTTYYIRAYAVNIVGVAYGVNVIFTTNTFSITTTPISVFLLTATSAIGGGNIISDGDSSILTVKDRGVCWNTFPSPTIENSKTSDGVGGGIFTSRIDSLTPFTTYFVRAYATNGNGTIYGNEVSFTTHSGVIQLTTDTASLITAYTATSGGTITSDGGVPVTERGICWNSSSSPTIANNKTASGSSIGTFTAKMTGLSPGITYYIRSYATNSVGISYGNEVSFLTQNGEIILTTTTASSIMATLATSGGTITSDGGEPITARGICWSTSSNPTIENSETNDGTGLGSFKSLITGLSANTQYFARAYAANIAVTTYGKEVSFTTNSGLTDIDGNLYNTVKIGTQTWMVENLKTTKYNDGTSIPIVSDETAWSKLSTPAYCWYNNYAANKNIYGALYNWYTVKTEKLAPIGWHVPTNTEWTTLENYLIANGYNYDGTKTGNKIAKAMAATSGWYYNSNKGSIGNDLSKNNTSGFAGLPGGYRDFSGGFYYAGSTIYWWSCTETAFGTIWLRHMESYQNFLYTFDDSRQKGFSVRCLRDN